MAYSSKTLSVIGYANGFTLWHYTTPDTAATVDTTGYFNAAGEMMRPGDFILANTGLGGSPQHGVFVVASNQNGQIDLADLMQVGGADTD